MFIDTNVLVHAASPDAPDRERARVALANVAKESDGLCISRQILREFVAVITRPQMWSKAKSPAEAAMAALKLAADFEILEDGAAVWDDLSAYVVDFRSAAVRCMTRISSRPCWRMASADCSRLTALISDVSTR